MLPLKWKIFRAFNYIYLVISLITIVCIIYALIKQPPAATTTIIISNTLCIFCPLIFAINCTINIYLLEKCYPEGYRKKLHKTALIFEILWWIVLALILLGFIVGIIEEFGDPETDDPTDKSGLWVLLLLFMLLSTGIYLCWMQIALRKTIRRNFENAMDNFLKN